MNPFTFRLFLLLTVAPLAGAFAAEPALIPRPASLEWGEGICPAGRGTARLVDPALPPEGYRLDITPTGVVMAAAGEAGFFYAGRTLEQLGPAPWPVLRIADQPRFRWRGVMLDASRHFQTVEFVKRYLDWLARYKLNVFHWHLTDGHGWRLEIKGYPKLTSVGAFREQPPVGRYGGFYTQEEVREVVRYAAERHITVVPEIEMPGHSFAAVASYPELGCLQQPQAVDYFYDFPCPAQRFPSHPGTDVLCVSREETFTFLTNVLTEVLALFPSTFIHVGGDEVNFAKWDQCAACQARRKELGLANGHAQQSWFMQRIDNFLTAHGRRLVGWDEILEGGLASNATVMSWRGIQGGLAAARSGHDAVMTPGNPLYFDHGQSEHPSEPKHWPGTETLEEVYAYEPVPAELTADQARHILGAQANLWTCFTHTDDLLELQTFPRLLALAEIAWSPAARREATSFNARLAEHRRWLDAQGIAHWVEPPPVRQIGAWAPDAVSTGRTTVSWDAAAAVDAPGVYTVEFDYQSGAHKLDVHRVALLEGDREVAVDAHFGFTGSRDERPFYHLELTNRSAGSAYRIQAVVSTDGGNDSRGVVRIARGGFRPAPPPPVPDVSTTRPVTQDRDRATYDWMTRHREILALNEKGPVDVVVIGDSITHYWGGEPKAPHRWGPAAWERCFAGLRVANLGFGWDRTENVCWRIDQGELDGLKPRLAILLIGTNNLGKDSEEDIAWGIYAICRRIQARSPGTRILVLGVLPRPEPKYAGWSGPDKVNYFLQTRLHDLPEVEVLDVGNSLRTGEGLVDRSLFRDGVHVNEAGYSRIADRLAGHLKALRP